LKVLASFEVEVEVEVEVEEMILDEAIKVFDIKQTSLAAKYENGDCNFNEDLDKE
jgi:hypothetical protein